MSDPNKGDLMDKQPNNMNKRKPARLDSTQSGRQTDPARKSLGRVMTTSTGRSVSRGAAMRAQRQAVSDANRVANQYLDAAAKHPAAAGDRPPRPVPSPTDSQDPGQGVGAGTGRRPEPSGTGRRANLIDDSPRLKIIGLGGMDGGGS